MYPRTKPMQHMDIAHTLGWSYFYSHAVQEPDEDKGYAMAIDGATKFYGLNKVEGDKEDQSWHAFLLGFKHAREYFQLENKFDKP